MATRANPDYTASAVKLTNPQSVNDLLFRLMIVETALNATRLQMDQVLQEHAIVETALNATRLQAEEAVAKLTWLVRTTIDSDGSYQDAEKGIYGVKQRKVSKEYDAQTFEARYPQFAPAVIIKAVNTAALNGLVKGGLLSEDELRLPSASAGKVITEKESFAFIIKSGFAPEEEKGK